MDIRLLRTVELFQHKPAILKKAEQRLEHLRAALIGELAQTTGPCPPEADRVKGQIVRGENLNGFPFISLDLPQLFHKETYFTYRVLFWWGHYLGFSLILMGGGFREYVAALSRHGETPQAQNIWLSLFETPWKWDLEEGRFQLLREAGEKTIREHAEQNGYLKLLLFYPVQADGFPELDWVDAGLKGYRHITQLIQT